MIQYAAESVVVTDIIGKEHKYDNVFVASDGEKVTIQGEDINGDTFSETFVRNNLISVWALNKTFYEAT